MPTPNFQKLADDGILFRKHFCNAPTCSASRATLVTGQCAHSAGMTGLAHRGWSLNDYSHHIIHTLRKEGYYSALVGVQHVAKDSSVIGYDETHWPSREGSEIAKGMHTCLADDLAKTAAKVLKERKEAGQPFFMSVGFFETHRPFPEVPEDAGQAGVVPDGLPDVPPVQRDMAAYIESAKIYDEAAGTVLDALGKTGLADNTLVVCTTTDHGLPFPGMKCNLTDQGTGIMLIMRGPGFKGGREITAMTSHMDIFPTICDLLGIDTPDWVEGKSFMPVVLGEKDEVNGAIVSEVTYHAAYEPMRGVRTRDWKYIRRFEERTSPVLPNMDDSFTKTYLMEHGLKDQVPDMEQLYDLNNDPLEKTNLAKEQPKVLVEMRERLDNWMERTNDPLLQGPVPAPKGSIMNDPDGVSPRDKPLKTE
jgi:arylsulfatase A-like enzyme